MKKEIFCSACGKKFIPVGREHICPSCKEEAAAAAKKAAVERAKARSYSGEACPVRISAKARGFIEAVAKRKGMKFIPTLDAILRPACKMYGFEDWHAVPEHKTARRGERAQATDKPQDVPQDAPQAGKPVTDKPQEVKQAAKPVKTAAKKAVKTTAGKASKTSKAAGKE